MILNKLEFVLMNNPLRRLIQDKVEMKELWKLSSLPKNNVILEIGCGSGYGTSLIKKYFSPQKIEAIDLDPRMIALAKKRLHDPTIHFRVASATALPFKNYSYDAIIDFAIIHHIPDWKNCIKELHRVLKPGGKLIIEDLSIETFNQGVGRIYQKVLDHPYDDMYTPNEFVKHLESLGFRINSFHAYYPHHLLKYFVVIAEKYKITPQPLYI